MRAAIDQNMAPGTGLPVNGFSQPALVGIYLAQQILRPARRFAAHIAIVNNPNRQGDTSQRWKVHVIEPIVRPFLA
jgi:hypothetical protein